MQCLPPRRWFQFRLRTLLLVTLACAPLFGWCANQRSKYRRQQVAIAELVGRQLKVTIEPVGPAWLRDLVGEKLLVRVDGVEAVYH